MDDDKDDDHDGGIAKSDPDRAAILARRKRFIAMALTGLTATAGACGDKGAMPQPCLDVAAPEPAPRVDVGAPQPVPQPCLEVAVPEPDSESASDGAEPTRVPKPQPQPCLNVRAPEPEPKPDPAPKPSPQPCLKVAKPR